MMTPAAEGSPNNQAPSVPTPFCRNTNSTVSTHSTASARPPTQRSASRALTPTVAKKMTSSLSRVVISKTISIPDSL